MKTSLAGPMTRPMGFVCAALVCVLFTASMDSSNAGIQGSGYRNRTTSYGTVDQFGSIFVNGVEYDVSSARIRINGQPGSESQLRLGQVVTVHGSVNADATEGAATDVSMTSAVVGPLAQVDLEGGTLLVLGQRIRLLPDTFLDQTLHLGGILGLVPGTTVQVSGFPNAAGEILATRVDLPIGIVTPRITGVVQALDPNAHTFKINSQMVDYGDVAPVGTLVNGVIVAVEGNTQLLQGVLYARSVNVLNGVGGAPGDLGQVAGVITAFNSASDFMMGSQRVVTDGDTTFQLNGQTLGPNLGVVVRGTFDGAGVLVAREVKATSTESVGAVGLAQSDQRQLIVRSGRAGAF